MTLEAGKPLPPSEARRRARKYLRQARHYQLNARRLFRAHDYPKAGEALWGAVASALKALSLVSEGRLLRAAEVASFGNRLARKLRIVDEYGAVQALHANFYDQFLTVETHRLNMRKGFRYLNAVLGQVRELARPPTAP